MAQSEIIDKPKRRRRIGWYFLAAVVLTLIGSYAFAFWRYERQQAAIAEIVRLNGYVDIEEGGPQGLRRIVGDERMKVFDRAVYVYLAANKQITNDGLRHLSGLTGLEELYLDATDITEERAKILEETLPNCIMNWW